MSNSYEAVHAKLKDILLGDAIQQKQYDFITSHQDQFSAEEENKHEYYDIFKKFQKLMEGEIDIQLEKNSLNWEQVEKVLAENAEKVANDDLFSIIELFSDFETFKEGMLGLDKQSGPMGIAIFMANKGFFKGEQQNFNMENKNTTFPEAEYKKLIEKLDTAEKLARQLKPLDDKWKLEKSGDRWTVHSLKNSDSTIDTFRIEARLKVTPDQIRKVISHPDPALHKARDDSAAIDETVEQVDENSSFTYFLSKDFVIVSAREAFAFGQFRKDGNSWCKITTDVDQGIHPKDTRHKGIRGTCYVWATFVEQDPKDPSMTLYTNIRQYSMNGLVPTWLQNKIGVGSGAKVLNIEKIVKDYNIV